MCAEDLRRNVSVGTAPVADGEIDEQKRDQHREEEGDAQNEKVKRVHAARKGRGLIRKQRELRAHVSPRISSTLVARARGPLLALRAPFTSTILAARRRAFHQARPITPASTS